MDYVVVQRHGADSTPFQEGCHRDICNCGEPLRGQLSATPKQLMVWIVRTNRDGEQGVYNVRFSIPINLKKCQGHQYGDWGRLRSDAPREGVDPTALP